MKRFFSLKTYLMGIVLCAVVPFLVFTTILINNLLDAKKEASERYLQKVADELALAFDQEITATIRTLDALSKGASLRKKDLKTFHGTIQRVLNTQRSWATVLLHDEKTKWILSAGLPFGTRFGAPLEPESLSLVLSTGLPQVGSIVPVPQNSLIGSPYAFAVRVPVKNDHGQIVFVLSAILTTDILQSLVGRFTTAPNEWTRALVDTRGTLGARSRDPEKFVGGPASVTLRELMKNGAEGGIRKTLTLENVPAYTGYRRAPFSSWYSAVAVPAEILEAQVAQTRFVILIAALSLLSLMTLAILALSRWVNESIQSGTRGAAALARGDEPQIQVYPIQELEDLRNSLKRASHLLRSKDRAKNEFLANMSHELRTPLGVVIGLTDLLSKDLVPHEERTKTWQMIDRNGRHLLHLIEDILDFSKIESGKLTAEKIDFLIVELVSAVVEDLSPKAMEKGVELKLTIDSSLKGPLRSDPHRVRQILSNLIGNSIKFTNQGRIEVNLSVTQDGQVQIRVLDTGIGLSKEQQKNLFQEFTQGDNSHTRKYGGTGLGLSLSRKLARLLGGDVRLVQSEPQKGSIFEFTLKGESSSS